LKDRQSGKYPNSPEGNLPTTVSAGTLPFFSQLKQTSQMRARYANADTLERREIPDADLAFLMDLR